MEGKLAIGRWQSLFLLALSVTLIGYVYSQPPGILFIYFSRSVPLFYFFPKERGGEGPEKGSL